MASGQQLRGKLTSNQFSATDRSFFAAAAISGSLCAVSRPRLSPSPQVWHSWSSWGCVEHMLNSVSAACAAATGKLAFNSLAIAWGSLPAHSPSCPGALTRSKNADSASTLSILCSSQTASKPQRTGIMPASNAAFVPPPWLSWSYSMSSHRHSREASTAEETSEQAFGSEWGRRPSICRTPMRPAVMLPSTATVQKRGEQPRSVSRSSVVTKSVCAPSACGER